MKMERLVLTSETVLWSKIKSRVIVSRKGREKIQKQGTSD